MSECEGAQQADQLVSNPKDRYGEGYQAHLLEQ
jgi:hypothetical protein